MGTGNYVPLCPLICSHFTSVCGLWQFSKYCLFPCERWRDTGRRRHKSFVFPYSLLCLTHSPITPLSSLHVRCWWQGYLLPSLQNPGWRRQAWLYQELPHLKSLLVGDHHGACHRVACREKNTFRFDTVVVWKKNAPSQMGSCIWMLSHGEVEPFYRIRKIRRRGLFGGIVSLGVGFEFSKVHTSPSLFSSLSFLLLPAQDTS